MIVKIGFDPATLKSEDEAHLPFQKGGMVLKFWALYKRSFITSQYFKRALAKFADEWEVINDKEKFLDKPYQNLDEFIDLLRRCDVIGHGGGPRVVELTNWVVKHWDYFSFNIQRPIVIEFERVEPVTHQMTVGGRE